MADGHDDRDHCQPRRRCRVQAVPPDEPAEDEATGEPADVRGIVDASNQEPQEEVGDDDEYQVRLQLGDHLTEAAAAARRHRHGQQHADQSEEGAGRADAEPVELHTDGRCDDTGQQVDDQEDHRAEQALDVSPKLPQEDGVQAEVERMGVQPHRRQETPPLAVRDRPARTARPSAPASMTR